MRFWFLNWWDARESSWQPVALGGGGCEVVFKEDSLQVRSPAGAPGPVIVAQASSPASSGGVSPPVPEQTAARLPAELAGEVACATPNRYPAGCSMAWIQPSGSRDGWAFLAGSARAIKLNGRLQPLGLCVLHDKDEITVGRHRLLFSTEEPAQVLAFPGLGQPSFCPRCKQKIDPGDLAVCCPTCQAWSHQSDKYPCWTYDSTCALCRQQSTDLEAGFNFNPAML